MATPTRTASDAELLAEADRADRAGDMPAAAAALRALLDRDPNHLPARLRFAQALLAAGERAGARLTLDGLEARIRDAAPELIGPLNRLLARADEADGALGEAVERWERVLADDIDDVDARAHLRALRPQTEASAGANVNPSETLVSPEGLETLRYRLVRELGRGATAAVYLARDESLGIDVALKVLHPHLAGDGRADARRRFFAEGRVAAAIRHPGVIAIYDVDEEARVLAMEHVAGGTLRARLARRSGAAAPTDEVMVTATSLLEALAHVHERGVSHGDLKPSNLLLRAPGDVVLADFGAAALHDAAPVTGDGAAGTPRYLAPERLAGARPSAPADLYAAGAILWEMATGRPLRTHADLLRGTRDIPPLPPEAAQALGPELTALVTSLVSTSPAARPSARTALLSVRGSAHSSL
jgi:tRNA A-37 threonylcarbamoyl transferase component Bud32